jgi:ComF family protein
METAALARASTCPRCALPVGPFADLRGGCAKCRGRSLGFDSALALGAYEGTMRDLCLRLKHERNAWLAPWLSGLLAEARRDELDQLPRDAWIVPIPLHWWRRLRRGYNQADALADGLARRLDLRVHQPLRRIKSTDRLARMGVTERLEALRGAFRARRDPGLRGRTVLLIDDILTTGATSGAAARALKKVGVRRVVVAVLARTV